MRALSRWLLKLSMIVALGLPGLSAAQILDEQAQAWVQQHGTVRVAPDPDFAPIDSFDARGRHVGLSAELLQLIAKRSGLRFEVKRSASFDAARAQLSSAEADLLSGVFRTDRRAKSMLFTRPYLHLPAALIGRNDSGAIDDLASLRQLRVAVVQGHVWQEILQDQGFDSELQASPNLRQALMDVAEGRADVYVGDLFTADHAIGRAGLKKLLRVVGQPGLEADLAFAIRTDLPDLKRVLDQALASVTVAEEAQLRARWESGIGEANDASVPIPDSLATDLAALKVAILAAPDLDEEQRSAATAQVEAASVRNSEADAALEQRASLMRQAEQARLEIERVAAPQERQSQSEELLRWRGSLPQRATVNDLEQLLSTEQAARTSLQETLAQTIQATGELQQRPSALRRELSELATRLEGISIAEADGTLRSRIDRIGRQAELRQLRARQSLLLAEQRQLDLQLQGLEARKQNLTQGLTARDERISVLEQRIAERSSSELNAEIESLRNLADRYKHGPPALRDLAGENLDAVDRLLALTQQLSKLREQVQNITVQANKTRLALSNAGARLKIGGVTDTIGMMLMSERRKLPNLAALKAQQLAMLNDGAEAQLAQIAISEERDQLANMRSAMAHRLAPTAESEAPLAPEQRAQLSDLLLLRAQLLPRLQQQYLRVQELLAEADAQLGKLIADTGALGTLLDQNLLWVPSHPPVAGQWTSEVWEQWRDLVKPSRWNTVADRAVHHLAERPLWVIGLLLPFVLLFLRPRIDRQLAELAARLRNLRQDRFRYTVRALLLTVLRATPMMLLSVVLARILLSVGTPGRFTHSLGLALMSTAPHIFFFTLIVALCRKDGLAHAHLRWPRARRTALLRLRAYLYFGIVPLLWLASVCFARDLDSVNGSLLRPVLLVLHLTLAAFTWWLLHPERLMSARGGDDRHPTLRRWLRLMLTTGFLITAVLPLFGFVLTSGILLQVSLNTLEVLLAVALVHGLTLRWLMLGERRLALARQAQEQSERADGGEPDGANLDAPSVVQDSVDIRLASSQSRSLLRALTVLLLGLGLSWSLADVAPAFAVLDRVSLWQTSVMVDGSAQISAVTLGSMTLALIVLLLGISAARNLPGLLEILLLERFTRDASVRYAIVAITRYVITFAMLLGVLNLLGLRWGHLQWLAAAFSVGLGFGLQEIFGNFAAGIILLFERPFRVGDVVTIGDLSGTVRRIRTRATTIVDFDNKEIVIPNKTFITERFVNWTLTDTTTRIVINVGVSYNSDPKLVRETLLEIANEHPTVLGEPGPAVVFMAMGASTLDFELRCFVPEIGDRLRAMNDIHTRIIDVFRARSISIAYPQLDLHVRQLPATK